MLKKGLMIGIVVALTLVAFSAVLVSDDSEAAVKDYDGVQIEVVNKKSGSGVIVREVKIYLGTGSEESDGGHYLYFNIGTSLGKWGDNGKKIAFVSKGIDSDSYPGDKDYNNDFSGRVLEIPDTITVKDDEGNDVVYTVVGIRNNAFKGNEYIKEGIDKTKPRNWKLRNLEKVIFPATIMAIGVSSNFERDMTNNGCSFSKCQNLTSIVFKTHDFNDKKGERSLLDFIGCNSFQDTRVEEVDLSKCENVTIRSRAFGQEYLCSNLKRVDLSGVGTIEGDAFVDCDAIYNIVMPTSGSAKIDPNAFPDREFYANEDSSVPLTGDELVGEAFYLGSNEKVVSGPVVTFILNGGAVKEGKYLERVYKEGESLPTDVVEKAGFSFYQWRDGSGNHVTEMPADNITLYAYWALDVPEAKIRHYNGDFYTPYSDTSDYTVSGQKTEVNAGDYTAILELTDNYTVWKDGDVYHEDIFNREWTIERISATVSVNGASPQDYSGSEQTIANGTCTGGELRYYVVLTSQAPTDQSELENVPESEWKPIAEAIGAGDYTVFWKIVNPDGNHNAVGPLFTNKVTAIINKVASSVTVVENQSFTYDGIAPTIEVTGKVGDGTVTFVYYTEETGGSPLVGTPVNAGTYYVVAIVAESENYSSYTTPSRTAYTINKAASAITIMDSQSSTYDGSAPTIEVTGKVGDGTVTFVYYTEETGGSPLVGTPVNAGTYYVVAIVAESENYSSYTTPSRTAYTINKATIVVSGITVIPKDFDGTKGANLDDSNVNFAGIVDPSKVTVTYIGSFDDANADENKIVTIIFTIDGDDKDNYELSAMTVFGIIRPLTVTLSWSNDSMVFNGNIQSPSAVVSNLISDDECNVTVSGGEINVGNYIAIAVKLDNANYVLPEDAKHAFVITNATITGDIEQDGSLTYSGDMLTADVYSTLTSVADQEITVVYSVSIDGVYSLNVPAFTEVGEYTVYYIASAPNHDDKAGSFIVTISAPHGSDSEADNNVLLGCIVGIAAVAGVMLIAPMIFGRP